MASKELKNADFLVIQATAINILKLKGNDLIIFSLIYNYSKDGMNKFTGSLDYLAKWTNSSPRSVMRNLQNLLELEYIEKHEEYINGIKLCSYNVTNATIDKMSIPVTLCEVGIDKMSNNNKVYNNKENTIINNSIKERFKKPTLEDLQEYCKEKNMVVDCEKFLNYYESNGWMVGKNHMKNWKAALTNWSRRGFDRVSVPIKNSMPDWYEEYKTREVDTYDYELDTSLTNDFLKGE